MDLRGKKVLIDPWVQGNPACPADQKKIDQLDLMLITHGHFDHIADAVTIAKEAHPSTIIGVAELCGWLGSKGVENCSGMNIGGTVKMRCTVGVNGRVSRCIVTRSSGVPELDALTPRLIEQRFVYRPATDRYGRPVPDDLEIEWTWD